MEFFNIGNLFLTFMLMCNSIELSLQQPPPHPIPQHLQHYFFLGPDNTYHLTGHPNARPFIVDGFLVGFREDEIFTAVDPNNLRSVLRITDHQMITLSTKDRNSLLRRHIIPEVNPRTVHVNAVVPENVPPSYEIINGVVHLTRNSIGQEAVVVDGLFLGTFEDDIFHPVNPLNKFSVLRVRTQRFTNVGDEQRDDMICRYIYDSELQKAQGAGPSQVAGPSQGAGPSQDAGPSHGRPRRSILSRSRHCQTKKHYLRGANTQETTLNFRGFPGKRRNVL